MSAAGVEGTGGNQQTMLRHLLLQEANKKRRKVMSASSYDELLRQVESLKSENGDLRKELQDNSSHLTKLEVEAGTMRHVLSNLQTSMADDADGNYALNLSFEQEQNAAKQDGQQSNLLEQGNDLQGNVSCQEDNTTSLQGNFKQGNVLQDNVLQGNDSSQQGNDRQGNVQQGSNFLQGNFQQGKDLQANFKKSNVLQGNFEEGNDLHHGNVAPQQQNSTSQVQGIGVGVTVGEGEEGIMTIPNKPPSNTSLLTGGGPERLELDQNSNASFTGSNSSFDGDETTTDQNWMSVHTNNLYSANSSLTEPGAGEQRGDHHPPDDPPGGGGGVSMDPRAPRPHRPMSCGGTIEGVYAGGHTQGLKSGSNSPAEGSPSKRRSCSGEQELYTFIQELDTERTSILREIEADDKHRKWYYEQLEELTKKIESLPLTETYNLQADMTRRQLEYEVSRLSDLMAGNLGTSEQIAQRHEQRLQRIRIIESEMLRMQQRHHDQAFLNKTGDVLDQGNFDPRLGLGSAVVTIGTQTPGEYQEQLQLQQGGGAPPPGVDHLQQQQQQQQQQDVCNTSNNHNLAALYHGSWPIDKQGSRSEGSLTTLVNQQDTASVMSFNSSNASSGSRSRVSNKQLGTKVEMVYSLLSMLGTHDKDDMSRTLFAMSSSQDSCIAMRQSGCLPLLVQLLHGSDKDTGLLGNTRGSKAARARAAAALHNIVHSHPDDKRGRREARVLRLLEQIRAHCDQLRELTEELEDEDESRNRTDRAADIDHHPGPAIAALMKLSFDEEHRHAICTLGGLQAIAELLQVDHDVNGNTTEQYNITMRRYACMALTNLTFGDGTNKALLCSMKSCMRALVAQLHSPNEDLRQVAASVLRNLSWRADLASKKTLREVGAVTALMCASMEVKKESTLKSILSALWNLSAHCSENKADICAVDGSLAFLVTTLTYKSPSKTLAIIENGGGILRNISSHIAVREDYRKILRQHGCLQILLKHLRSPSLTIVSNACGTLWNLSARCPEDQKSLWEMGAVSMLRNLVHSKHKMISMGSAAALKNLLAAKPAMVNLDMDRHTKSNMPSLHVRKQRALEAELDQNLAETCDNVESPQGSPTEIRKHDSSNKFMYTTENCGIYQVADNESRRSMLRGQHLSRNLSGENSPRSPVRSVSRSASQDSVGSTHSDISYDRNRVQDVLRKSSKLLQERQNMNLDRRREHSHRYNNSSAGSIGEGMRMSGSDSSITDRARGSGPNSRIMQVMHEVAVHAGIDPGPFTKEQYGPNLQESQSAEGTPQNVRQSSEQQGRRAIPLFIPREGQSFNHGQADLGESPPDESDLEQLDSVGQTEGGRGLQHYASLSQCMDDEDDHVEDEPINYSMKYSESPRSECSDQNTSSTFVKPVPKVTNVVTGVMQTTDPANKQQQGKKTNVVQPNNKQQVNNINNMNIPQYSGYAETDLDNEEMDQPTNYSIRFAEHNDDGHFTDQPINYSTRYKEPEGSCVECKMEAHRCNEYVEHLEPHIDDDTMRTFCTEGTPLNYLSTATSMNDLSGKGNKYASEDHKDGKAGGMPPPNAPPPRRAYSESCVGHSHHHAAVVGPAKHVEAANIQNNNVPGVKSVSTTPPEPTQLYSYDDDSASASPNEKPTKYCTEGTPRSFSRVSSLSSLHSSEAQDHTSPAAEPRSRDDLVLQSIDENTSLEITTSADVTLCQPENQNESYQSSANTTTGSQGNDSHLSGTTTKSVTFDDNNQVQETPLMFSRCSSLGSLSSFDAHSVHSSVVSEYSRRASEVVSPSDLPDSPSDTMPPSPTHRKSPIKFIGTNQAEESEEEDEADVTQIEKLPARSGSDHSKKSSDKVTPSTTTQQGNQSQIYNDLAVRFAEEDSPVGFSCGSSLSRLTIDDEPHLEKDSNLRRVPLGQEDDQQEVPTVISEPENTAVPAEPTSPIPMVDLDDDLSVSEGEEDMLTACINLAMPNNSRKEKKMRRSSSDSYLKKKAGLAKVNSLGGVMATSTPSGKSRLPMKMPNIAHVAPMSPYTGASYSPRMNASYHGGLSHHDDLFEAPDTPQKFATEGTPLNFSNAGSLGGSLSDLSLGDETQHHRGDGESDVYHTPNKPTASVGAAHGEVDDTKSDISSLSEECEDLLSEAIEAAMPKNKPKAKKMDRVAEGSDTKLKMRYQIPAFKPKKAFVDSQQSAPNHRTVSLPTDTVRSYATEGTPLNFSTANSLSDLSCEDSEPDTSQEEVKKSPPKRPVAEVLPPPPAYQDTSHHFHNAFDSPRAFGVEGTPVSFSRNDSLSSLSCDEDADLGDDKEQLKQLQGPRGHVSPGASATPPSAKGSASKSRAAMNRRIGQLSGSSTPVHPKTRTASRAHRSLQYEDGSEVPEQPDPPDQAQLYAVEGTPNCFSRNSSLSSLNSDDHEGLAQRNSGSGSNENSPEPVRDQSASFHQVEDTPQVFSCNSSLSSLSVESLSYEPTASEKALLEECINAAMPKNKSTKKKKSPSTASAPRVPKMKTSRSDDSSLSAKVDDEQSKNVRASQSKNESITEESRGPNDASGLVFRRSASEGSKTRFGWRRPTSDSNDKQCKEEYNQEQVLGNNSTLADTSNVTNDSYSDVVCDDDVIEESVDSGMAIPPPSDFSNNNPVYTLENSVHLGEQNEILQNVFMEMPTALESDPDKQRISDDDMSVELTSDKEQKAIAINEKDHCSEPSENEDVDSIGSCHSVGERNNFGHTKERASFYLEGNLEDSHLARNVMEVSGEVPDFMDITAETFPKSMEVSLISDISTPGEDNNPFQFTSDVAMFAGMDDLPEPPPAFNDTTDAPPPAFSDSADDSGCRDSTDFDTPVTSSDTTVVETADLEEMLEWSPEQERALEENASLIVSELSLTRQMSCSTLDEDEDLFIEDETISLVSNDCMSDTASEASIALSSSSKTVSEQASESSTVSRHSSAPSVGPKSPGPRIVKPGLSRFKKPEETEPADSPPKGIRGKRRSLFARVTPKPLKSPSPPPGKLIRGGGGTPAKVTPPKVTPPKVKSKEQPKEQSKQSGTTSKPPAKPQQRLRTPPPPKNTSRLSAKSLDSAKATPPKVPVRDSSLKPSNSSSTRTASPSTSTTTKVTPVSPKAAHITKLTTPPKGGLSKIASKISTGLPRPSGKGKDSPPKAKTPVEPERPPPPVKQGTFTKDEPTHNDAPEINGENSDKRASTCSQGSNRSSAELKYSSESQEKLSRGAAGTRTPNRHSSGSLSERPGSWSRSLDCDADSPVENGIQKSNSPAPLTAIRKSSSGSVSKSSSSGSLGKVSKSSSSSSMGKTGSTGSVNKSASNTSVNKLGTKSPLTKSNSGPTGKKTSAVSPMRKTTSNTSLTKTTTPGKSDIKKSESQASLGQKTGLANPRPSTPPSRKLSGGNTPSPAAKNSGSPASNLNGLKKPQAAGSGKKPAVSKIAGLWRKEDKPAKTSTDSPKSKDKEEKTPAKSSLKSPKPSRRSLLSVVKPSLDKKKAEAEKKADLTRSSTYDKLPVPENLEEGASGVDLEDNPNAGTKKEWRRTYTIDPEDEVTHAIDIGLDTPSPVVETIPKPKKSSSIWRRNTADSDAIQVKATPKKMSLWKKGSTEEIANTTEEGRSKLPKPGSSGVWMRRSGSLIPSPNAKATQEKAALTNGHDHKDSSHSVKELPKHHPQPLSAISPTSDEKTMTVSSPKGELNAAIVPPYNYTPKVAGTPAGSSNGTSSLACTVSTRVSPVRMGKVAKQQFTEVNYSSDEGVMSVQGLAPKPKSSISTVTTKPLTKTEMLIARRRQSYLNSRNKTDKAADKDTSTKSACLVTTV